MPILGERRSHLRDIVSKNGISTDEGKVRVILELPPPTNYKGVQRFMGHVGYYRRFILNYAELARPLYRLLVEFNWTEECQNSYDKLKWALAITLILQTPNWNLPFHACSWCVVFWPFFCSSLSFLLVVLLCIVFLTQCLCLYFVGIPPTLTLLFQVSILLMFLKFMLLHFISSSFQVFCQVHAIHRGQMMPSLLRMRWDLGSFFLLLSYQSLIISLNPSL